MPGGESSVSRSRAGPSKPAAKPKRKPTSKVVPETESEDMPRAQDDSEEDEIVQVDPPKSRKPVNGKAVAAKGKGKAPSEAASRKQAVEVIDDDEDEIGPVGTARAINNATANNKRDLAKENERMRRRLQMMEKNIQSVTAQLEEVLRVRETEPEELAKRQAEKYEEQIEAKDLLIKQYEEMLGRQEPLSTNGKSSVLHMVTREKADQEKRSAEDQVTYWKGVADEREKLIREKNTEIENLRQLQRDLEYEVKTERELAQKASSKPPVSAPRTRGPNPVLGSEDPKHTQLVSLYEDITNLLITDIKVQESNFFNLEDWTVTCIYTQPDSQRSLGFLLRFVWEPTNPDEIPESPEDLEKGTSYTPLNLDKESPHFIDELDFLNTGFAFPRRQLPIFFASLVKLMKAACLGVVEDSEAGSMDGVEPTD
ncbi:hypothetical protein FB45DRAFT_1057849 [Roridomyces roridus]|uniref:Monopolin complex subunit Csm1/Pcs1 C-terminal domain-containing protein n=1 Tax=Roridomyces roridus TaxID=1738132 RepID=A0AAD7FR12_9AGAR|nr:hypothetical protein FB45DRAFT_1057849 [Roridomyces roridus]